MSGATVAQLVEQTIRNRPVKGSIPFGGFILLSVNVTFKKIHIFIGWINFAIFQISNPSRSNEYLLR
jgi:hypothetical protein